MTKLKDRRKAVLLSPYGYNYIDAAPWYREKKWKQWLKNGEGFSDVLSYFGFCIVAIKRYSIYNIIKKVKHE